MSSFTSSPVKGGITARSAGAFAELVNKIATSPSSTRQRLRKAQKKKVLALIREGSATAKRSGKYALAMTLTYSNNADFSPKHISRFIDKVRAWLRRLGHQFTYVWVLERQSRLHYHLIVWLPRGVKLDLVKLAKWWPSGCTWTAHCNSVRDWGAYMAKFSSPAGSFRKNMRLYGSGGFDATAKQAIMRAGMPRWLLRILPRSRSARRFPGGGWVDITTGEIFRSPYLWTPFGMLMAAAVVAPPV
ncbi:MAG: hypothetical protein ITG07_09245 [Candidimonas sp.]|nr:hypothetical protein [Candidimonas sp.]